MAPVETSTPPAIGREELFDRICEGLYVDAEQIRAYGFHLASEGTGDFSEHLLRANQYCTYSGGIKYSFLTTVAKEQVTEHLLEKGLYSKDLKWGSFESGLGVIGRFLNLGVKTYAELCAEQARDPSLEELTAILHRSYSTLARFARMDNEMNRRLEAIYGLREPGRAPEMEGCRDFKLVGEPGSLRLEPADWENSLLRATARLLLSREDPTQIDLAKQRIFNGVRCGAYDKLLPTAYHWAVDFAAATHEFFASDLKAIIDTDE